MDGSLECKSESRNFCIEKRGGVHYCAQVEIIFYYSRCAVQYERWGVNGMILLKDPTLGDPVNI